MCGDCGESWVLKIGECSVQKCEERPVQNGTEAGERKKRKDIRKEKRIRPTVCASGAIDNRLDSENTNEKKSERD